MIGWGVFLIILGAGSLLLPEIGVQFRLMELVDAYQPWAGTVVAVAGAALIAFEVMRAPEAPDQAPATTMGDLPAEDPSRQP